MTEFTVEHNIEEAEFFVQLDNTNDKAYAKYRLEQNGSIDFYTTFVPPSFRGKGIAEELVDTALAWANNKNLKIHASCWYVEKRIAAAV